MQLQQEKLVTKTICFANVGCSPTPRQHFWKTAAPKNFLIAYGLWLKTMFSGNQLRTIRQIRFAVCLCAVRRWLRYPNCLWMFLRLQLAWSFFVFKTANSRLLVPLRFQYHLINTSVREDSLSSILEDALPFCPFGTFPHTVGNHPPPPSWASSTAVACGS